MAIKPADIEQMTFSEAKKHGYNTEEVDAFLDRLAGEIDAMLQKIADLHTRLNNSEQQLAAAQATITELREGAGEPEKVIEYVPAPAEPSADLAASERQISQVLIVAQQSADKMVADAQETADNIRSEAEQKAREVIRQALAEKQSELEEMDRLKQSREDFRNEYKRLLQHFMDDADSVFPEKGKSSSGSASSRVETVAAPRPVVTAAEPEATTYAPALIDTDFSDLD